MNQFKSAGQAQRFLSAHDQINNLFLPRRDHVTAAEHRAPRIQTYQVWVESCKLTVPRQDPRYYGLPHPPVGPRQSEKG